ncbi:protein jag [Chloroflexota bacterium]
MLTPDERGDIAEEAKGVLEAVLAKMGLSGSIVSHTSSFVELEEAADSPITLDINGDDLGILIGRRGQTLASLQHIVRVIISHQRQSWVPIIIDVEGYKQRRHEALRALALRMAEQVKANSIPFTLEPMPAYERRIIHLTLVEHPDVTTQSIGEGESRKVIILPKTE